MLVGLIKTIFYIVLAYYVWRLLDNFFGNNGGQKQRRKSNSDVKFQQKPQDKSHIPDNEGDYIDYEELK